MLLLKNVSHLRRCSVFLVSKITYIFSHPAYMHITVIFSVINKGTIILNLRIWLFQNFTGGPRRIDSRDVPVNNFIVTDRDYLQNQSRYANPNPDWPFRTNMVDLSHWQLGRHDTSPVNVTTVNDRQVAPGYSVQYDALTSERARYNNAVYKARDEFDNRVTPSSTQNKDSQRCNSGTCLRSVVGENATCCCVKTPYCGLLNSYARGTERTYTSASCLNRKSSCNKQEGGHHSKYEKGE